MVSALISTSLCTRHAFRVWVWTISLALASMSCASLNSWQTILSAERFDPLATPVENLTPGSVIVIEGDPITFSTVCTTSEWFGTEELPPYALDGSTVTRDDIASAQFEAAATDYYRASTKSEAAVAIQKPRVLELSQATVRSAAPSPRCAKSIQGHLESGSKVAVVQGVYIADIHQHDKEVLNATATLQGLGPKEGRIDAVAAHESQSMAVGTGLTWGLRLFYLDNELLQQIAVLEQDGKLAVGSASKLSLLQRLRGIWKCNRGSTITFTDQASVSADFPWGVGDWLELPAEEVSGSMFRVEGRKAGNEDWGVDVFVELAPTNDAMNFSFSGEAFVCSRLAAPRSQTSTLR